MNEMEKTEMVGEEGDFMEFETVDPKWITIRLSDFLELAGLKEQAGSIMNPPENKASEINSKLPTNKNRKVKR